MSSFADPSTPRRPLAAASWPPADAPAKSDVEPRLFGPAETPLFGCYHAPLGTPRQSGVVLCAPFGQELLRTHRALRLLASRLARAGFAVLRFDYRGCGDSSGDADAGDLAQWTADTRAAIDELRSISGAATVALAGLRLGGSLALLAADGRDDVRHLVLWEPVVDGRAYLERLFAVHRSWRDSMFGRRPDGDAAPDASEALGFPVPDRLRTSLERLALSPPAALRRCEVLVLEDASSEGTETLRAQLDAAGARVAHRRVDGARIGMNPADLGQVWVPGAALQAIQAWLGDCAR